MLNLIITNGNNNKIYELNDSLHKTIFSKLNNIVLQDFEKTMIISLAENNSDLFFQLLNRIIEEKMTTIDQINDYFINIQSSEIFHDSISKTLNQMLELKSLSYEIIASLETFAGEDNLTDTSLSPYYEENIKTNSYDLNQRSRLDFEYNTLANNNLKNNTAHLDFSESKSLAEDSSSIPPLSPPPILTLPSAPIIQTARDENTLEGTCGNNAASVKILLLDTYGNIISQHIALINSNTWSADFIKPLSGNYTIVAIATNSIGSSTQSNHINLNVLTNSSNTFTDNDNIINIIYAEAGNDTVYGGSSDDIILAGAGTDKLYGGGGDDKFIINAASSNSANSFYGQAGNDKIIITDNQNLLIKTTFDASNSIEDIIGQTNIAGQKITSILGTSGHNTIDLSATTLTNIKEINGRAGNDKITGSSGDDTIITGLGWDKLKGEDGDDTFIIRGNIDNTHNAYGSEYDGGNGNDKIIAEDANNVILRNFDASNSIEDIIDKQILRVKKITSILGTSGHNTIDLSATTLTNIKEINGRAGNDKITGSSGDDTIITGLGWDKLKGEDGDDTFIIRGNIDNTHNAYGSEYDGGNGNDKIIAEDANNVILRNFDASNSIEDIIGQTNIAGQKITSILGTSGHNTIDLSATTLTNIKEINGRAGNDKITGSSGDDTIITGLGWDKLKGEDGDDTFIIRGNIDNTHNAYGSEYDGGNGNDKIIAEDANNVILRNFDASNSIEDIVGQTNIAGQKITSILGTSGHNTIDLSATTLTNIKEINGRAGNDKITGSSGDDTIITGLGWDKLKGEDGDDTFIIRGNIDNTHNAYGSEYDGGNGNDKIIAEDANNVILRNFDASNSIEDIIGQTNIAGQKITSILGTSGHNTIDLSATTLTNIKEINGRAGNDKITGSSGDDTIITGLGWDKLKGEDGDDTFIIRGNIDNTHNAYGSEYDGGNGNDKIIAEDANNVILRNFDASNSIEDIVGQTNIAGQKITSILGTSGHNTIDLSATTLTNIKEINGRAGNDKITGSSGDDTIITGLGWDKLKGEDGDDTFIIRGNIDNTHNAYGSEYDGGNGNDKIIAEDANNVILRNFDASNSIEDIVGQTNIAGQKITSILGTSGHNTIDLSATTLTNIKEINGRAGNDKITGSSEMIPS